MLFLNFFKKNRKLPKEKNGFTLIEMLVVVGVLSVILSITGTYTRTGEKQIVLFRDQAKLISAFQRAKSLGLSAFGENGSACGYGIHINKPKNFIVFKDLPNVNGDCSSADKKYNGDSTLPCGGTGNLECVESHNLNGGISFTDDTSMTDMIFIPPDPTVLLFPDTTSAKIKINVVGSDFTKSVQVNNFGQITAL